MDFASLGSERSSRRVGLLSGAGGAYGLVWGPSGVAFDYPFSDWRGPTGGWGNS